MSGRGGGDGGDNPLALFMMIVLGGALIGAAIAYVILLIYNTIQFVIHLAPHFFTALLGVGLSVLYVSQVPPHEGAKLESVANGWGGIFAPGMILLFVGFVTSFYLGLVPDSESLGGATLALALLVLWAYGTYKIDRLVGGLSNGETIRLVTLSVVFAGVSAVFFQTPLYGVLPTVLLVGTVYGPFLIGTYVFWELNPPSFLDAHLPTGDLSPQGMQDSNDTTPEPDN